MKRSDTHRLPPTRRSFLKAAAFTGMLAAWMPAELLEATKKQSLLPLYKDLNSVLPFYRKKLWADIVEDPRRMLLARGYDRVTIHHQGEGCEWARTAEGSAQKIRNIQTGHMNRHYGDIGYHFVIDYAGRVWQGRSLRYQGAHVSDRNPGNVGIMLLGNFEKQRPSPHQLASLPKLIRVLRQYLGIQPTKVYGHRDLAHTLCPGIRLYNILPYIRSKC